MQRLRVLVEVLLLGEVLGVGHHSGRVVVRGDEDLPLRFVDDLTDTAAGVVLVVGNGRCGYARTVPVPSWLAMTLVGRSGHQLMPTRA